MNWIKRDGLMGKKQYKNALKNVHQCTNSCAGCIGWLPCRIKYLY